MWSIHQDDIAICAQICEDACWDKAEQVGESGYRGMRRQLLGHLETKPFSDMNKRQAFDAKARGVERANLV